MKYFIFRNQTIEQFFGDKNCAYSGYDDITLVPAEAENYIWFYQMPVNSDSRLLSREINSFAEKLELVATSINPAKPFIVFTLESLFTLRLTGDSLQVRISIDGFNRKAIELSKVRPNVKVVDLSEFTLQYSADQLFNWKFYFISQTVLNPKLAKDFKIWWEHIERELALKRKKCLVLDLDNTLWGGILGEDGPAGIQLGGDYPGKAFTYWQAALLELGKNGVILAVCSKNNEADVFDAWQRNPYMVLKKEHFAAFRINWQDKATNIQELASELNIGLDSMVFVDDNPTERELVRQLLPMVEVPEFPQRPYELMSFFKSLVEHYFQVYSVTSEDMKKTEQYKQNAQRRAAQASFTDMDDYLRSLEMSLHIMSVDKFNLSRLAQMTQKTNQFNLTTKRYVESDLRQMLADGCRIYCVSVSDRFGDNGITGEIILRPMDATTIEIDSLLLSCRILGKGIETAFINTILNLLADDGVKTVKASYIKTAKNAQVEDFYDRMGFTVTGVVDDIKHYQLQLADYRENKDYYLIKID
ncbi:MAG: HAD-IIIC family phosphatase [Muribaculaceae bacterium]|nr:HAD-IIIC family phosphatase [Muribaculaceae bacterium]